MAFKINFGEIADIAFNNILGTSGFVRDGVVYKNVEGKEEATDVAEKNHPRRDG